MQDFHHSPTLVSCSRLLRRFNGKVLAHGLTEARLI
jgi:hypothetical protein